MVEVEDIVKAVEFAKCTSEISEKIIEKLKSKILREKNEILNTLKDFNVIEVTECYITYQGTFYRGSDGEIYPAHLIAPTRKYQPVALFTLEFRVILETTGPDEWGITYALPLNNSEYAELVGYEVLDRLKNTDLLPALNSSSESSPFWQSSLFFEPFYII